MIRRYLDGDVEGARELNAELIDPVSFQSSDEAPNPLPTKAVLRVLGLPGGRVPASDGARAGVARAEGAGDARRPGPGGRAGWPQAERRAGMAEPVRISFLGGLGEIGRNCAVFEQDGRLVVLDCGVMFPNPEMPGVDLVLPDFTFLRERAGDVDGIVLTHGHEDHVGGAGVPAARRRRPRLRLGLTLGFARNRLDEAGLGQKAPLVAVRDGERRKIGPFDVEFIPVTHSVPSGFALAIHTAQGVVLHSGDFKLDLTPVDGRRTDLARIGQIADDRGHPAAAGGLDERRAARLHR